MKIVCAVCGALFVDGVGFVEKHYHPCRNNTFGENWGTEVDDNWKRPAGEVSIGGRWNEEIDRSPKIRDYLNRSEVLK